MKRGGPLRRRSPMRRINRARLAKRRAVEFGPQAQRCREMPCCVPTCRRQRSDHADPAHIRSRAAGGKDRANIVPLCRVHHIEQHGTGIRTFQDHHGIDLQQIADAIAWQLEEEGMTW